MVLMAEYDHTRVNHLRQAEELAHFAHSVEIDTRVGESLGRDIVTHVGEKAGKRVKTAMIVVKSGTCERIVRTRAPAEKSSGKAGGKAIRKSKVHFTMALEETGSGSDLWILDNGSCLHMVVSDDFIGRRGGLRKRMRPD